MRKKVLFLFVVLLLFNITATAETSNGERFASKDTLAAFSIYPEYGSDFATVKLSDISRSIGLSFSYNPETGFIYADSGNYRIYIKAIDDNIEINENVLVFKNLDKTPYPFRIFMYVCRQDGEKYLSYSIIAEATVEFGETAQFLLRNVGTSSHVIDKENIKAIIKNNMLLVNKDNTLDRSYFPPDLVSVKLSKGRSAAGMRLDREAMEQLNIMLNAAYNDGVSGMVITSTFRNFEKQTSLFNNKIETLSRNINRKAAMEEAAKVVAVPGTSEHQTGFAADICSDRVSLVEAFARTKQGKWLEDNSWKFGFVIRYPKDKTEITRIIYEPWHVRYVGNVHSEIMKAKDMCLEEYVEYLKNNRIIHFRDSSGADYAVQYIDKEQLESSGMTLNLNEGSTWEISNCTKDSYVLTIKL